MEDFLNILVYSLLFYIIASLNPSRSDKISTEVYKKHSTLVKSNHRSNYLNLCSLDMDKYFKLGLNIFSPGSIMDPIHPNGSSIILFDQTFIQEFHVELETFLMDGKIQPFTVSVSTSGNI